ncbi:hypothetical protein ABHF33_03340 [Chitinibacter sp. FCG-7]|uniref:DUF2384 domain-containing protein n=1 Tax=Chitinibacter mangrovi TaxID=3153927 RepID=A0AAU7FBN2_9NEIS
MNRIPEFLALLESELVDQPDLYADLRAVMQFEPYSLLPWLPLLDAAVHKLGDLPTVVKWLTCPHIELNGAAPASLVGSDNGVARARALLEKYEPLPPWRKP